MTSRNGSDSSETHTHVACCDESYVSRGRFRGVAAVSTRGEHYGALRTHLRAVLVENGVSELKWNKLNGKDHFDAAVGASSLVVNAARAGRLRVDVLVWDTYDSRHRVSNRDDLANLHRMYHHLLHAVMGKRWPSSARWMLVPDESTCLRHNDIHYFLSLKERKLVIARPGLFDETPSAMWRRVYRVTSVVPQTSHDNELIQVADIMAGMGAFAREAYGDFAHWCDSHAPQQRLWSAGPTSGLSNTDKCRFPLMFEFNRLCKQSRMRVSLRSHRGFRTMNPSSPINFWWYEPQHALDKAPTTTPAGKC